MALPSALRIQQVQNPPGSISAFLSKQALSNSAFLSFSASFSSAFLSKLAILSSTFLSFAQQRGLGNGRLHGIAQENVRGPSRLAEESRQEGPSANGGAPNRQELPHQGARAKRVHELRGDKPLRERACAQRPGPGARPRRPPAPHQPVFRHAPDARGVPRFHRRGPGAPRHHDHGQVPRAGRPVRLRVLRLHAGHRVSRRALVSRGLRDGNDDAPPGLRGVLLGGRGPGEHLGPRAKSLCGPRVDRRVRSRQTNGRLEALPRGGRHAGGGAALQRHGRRPWQRPHEAA